MAPMDIINLWNVLQAIGTAVPVGIVQGITWGGIVYAVKYVSKKEKFDGKNLLTAVLVGIGINAIAAGAGTDVETASNYSVLQIFTIFGDKIVGTVMKGFSKKH